MWTFRPDPTQFQDFGYHATWRKAAHFTPDLVHNQSIAGFCKELQLRAWPPTHPFFDQPHKGTSAFLASVLLFRDQWLETLLLLGRQWLRCLSLLWLSTFPLTALPTPWVHRETEIFCEPIFRNKRILLCCIPFTLTQCYSAGESGTLESWGLIVPHFCSKWIKAWLLLLVWLIPLTSLTYNCSTHTHTHLPLTVLPFLTPYIQGQLTFLIPVWFPSPYSSSTYGLSLIV